MSDTKFAVVGKVHVFNTGRMYAADGQRIVWAILRSGSVSPASSVVAFSDRSRGIDGVIDLHFGNLDLVNDGWVLRAYDDFHYSHLGYEAGEALRAAARAAGVL